MNELGALSSSMHSSRWGGSTLALCVSFVLSACSMSPGMYMGKPGDIKQSLEEQGAPPRALMTISPALIAAPRAAQNEEGSQDAQQLPSAARPASGGCP